MQGFQLSTDYYRWLTEALLALAEKRGGRILFCLEGGYDPEALADSVAASLHAMARAARAPFEPPPPVGEGDHPELEAFRRRFRGVVR